MKLPIRNICLLLFMLAAAVLAISMRPTLTVLNQPRQFQLEKIIPSQFGDWKEHPHGPGLVTDPSQKENLERIYTDVLSRTYENSSGYQVMLSIAYGADQRDSMQVHKPEICYPAQGFRLLSKETGRLTTPFGQIPVVRIETQMGPRREPVMYWVTVGETVVQGNIQKKLAEIRFGLKGQIPDGLIFRVSSIDADKDRAMLELDRFSNMLLAELSVKSRKKMSGL